MTIRRALPVIAGLAALAAVVWFAHPRQVVDSLDGLNPLYLALALLLNVPLVVLRSVRAQQVVHRLGHRVTLARMLPVQLLGQTSSSLSPAASGDLVRAYFWRRHDGLLLAATAAALMVRLRLPGPAGAALAAACLPLPPLALWAMSRLPEGMERTALGRLSGLRAVGRFARELLGTLGNLRLLVGSAGLLTRATILTLLAFSTSGLQLWLLLSGLGTGIPLSFAIGTSSASEVAGTLSSLPFGLGPSDAVVVTLLAQVGVEVAAGASVAVLLRAVTTLPLSLAGLGAYLVLERSRPGALEAR